MIQRATLVLAAAGMVLATGVAQVQAAPGTKAKVSCPVMKAPLAHPEKAAKLMVNNQPVYFCCPGCDTELRSEPAKFLTQNLKDPVNGKSFTVTAKSPKADYKGRFFIFSSPQTLETFKKNPAKFVKA